MFGNLSPDDAIGFGIAVLIAAVGILVFGAALMLISVVKDTWRNW